MRMSQTKMCESAYVPLKPNKLFNLLDRQNVNCNSEVVYIHALIIPQSDLKKNQPQ